MLISLYVENIAIIKKISMDFSEGFTILTGETGAGKSILIDSIGLLLGAKARRELIGPFGEHAVVKAVFEKLPQKALQLLAENDISLNDDAIFVERKISKDGRSTAKINAIQVPVSFLQSLAVHLINIHGQHDHISMLNSSVHIEFLDKFIGLDTQLKEYRQEYANLKNCRDELKALQTQAEQRQERVNQLSFKLQEYQTVQPYVGMLSYLQEKRKMLRNQEEIHSFFKTIHPNEEASLNVMISNAISKLQKLMELDERFREFYEQLTVMQELAASVITESEDIISGFDIGESLDEVEDKLYALEQLLNRYGPSEEEILLDWENTQKEFETLNNIDESISKSKNEYLKQLNTVQQIASDISEKRRIGAQKLSQAVQGELAFLDMKGVVFQVQVENNVNAKGGYVYNDRGFDKVEFLISTNAGHQPKPLHKIASGGELSRIMLSLTKVLNTDWIGTFIFDEIDTGVSGKTAEKIGVKLKEVAKDRQVICITHLAQIASMGHQHFKIGKNVADGQVQTEVHLLEGKQRIDEIARIIGGIEITDTIRKTASEMLNKS